MVREFDKMKDASAVYARTSGERESSRNDLFVGFHESSSALRLMAANSVWRFSARAGVTLVSVREGIVTLPWGERGASAA
jgi:hypothetical protein